MLDLPIMQIDETEYGKILHGELLDKNMFSEDKLTIMEHEGKIAALYTPFNKSYFKPEKVLI